MNTSDEQSRITPAVEDYLKAIYMLQQHGVVTTSLLGEQRGSKPGSVTGMIKKLAEMNLVEHTPYQGVCLTPAGERVALEVIRHHRLLELYLVEALGYSWDEVHEEAEKLEHHISEKLEARIAAHLGHPTFDPHGDPIPTLEGTLPERIDLRLADLAIGEHARIVRVRDQSAERLRYLADLGLIPGALIDIIASAPFDGPLSLRLGSATHALDRRMARTIEVERVE
ncbi:metal-dependent transcriptional regulator [Candidatus Viridilinea mediisalina]|uniref:Manganese transport regulator n=1 Tax=Candidatus Viridilinea mediisalina TaxID=2024553 RepID=A0A2A6RPC5_9CHLR|nr:metal-dependent transcriptional regulator [Candidatus Viridilinea mediisalina]PDW04700.1 DtxR family transcriptional regulator [Candidatus Viridilinea mediisalina]